MKKSTSIEPVNLSIVHPVRLAKASIDNLASEENLHFEVRLCGLEHNEPFLCTDIIISSSNNMDHELREASITVMDLDPKFFRDLADNIDRAIGEHKRNRKIS